MTPDDFVRILSAVSRAEILGPIHSDIVQRHGFKRSVSARAAFKIAKTAIFTAKELIAL